MIIASFPKGSFPEYTWPVGTWLAAPEGADIQYTEVMEFAVCIAASAGLSVVLPNAVAVADTSTMTVSGAGVTGINNTYIYTRMFNGKPYYSYNSDEQTISWEGSPNNYWLMLVYRSFDDVATPDLCTTWEAALPEYLPLPTVTAPQVQTLTEVAAFTLEMPMVVEIETYEELSL